MFRRKATQRADAAAPASAIYGVVPVGPGFTTFMPKRTAPFLSATFDLVPIEVGITSIKSVFLEEFWQQRFFFQKCNPSKNTAILLSGSYRCWHKQCDVSLQSNVRTFVLFFIWWVRRISCCRRWRRWGVFLCTHSDSGSLTLFFCSSSSFFYKFEFQGNCTLRELGIALVGGSSTQDRSANGIFIGNVEPGGRIARAAPSICKGFKIVGRY